MNADLVGWLRAQLDDREREAQMLLAEAQQAMDLLRDHQRFVLGRLVPGWHTWPDVKRFAETALAEVASARAILDLHQPVVDTSWPHPGHCTECWDQTTDDYRLWPCRTVRLIVRPYAGREGWREEWRA